VTGQLARRLAVPAPPGIPRLVDRVQGWEQSLREDAEELGHPLSRRALGAALATLQDLAGKQPDTMIHGDLHFGNVVRARREPWLVIDPSGLAGDLASDALQVLKRGADSLLAADDLETELRRRLAIFADAAEIDRERAIRWAQVQAAMGAHRSRKSGKAAWIIQGNEQIAELLAEGARGRCAKFNADTTWVADSVGPPAGVSAFTAESRPPHTGTHGSSSTARRCRGPAR
jgi:streptomycin 6-kinase